VIPVCFAIFRSDEPTLTGSVLRPSDRSDRQSRMHPLLRSPVSLLLVFAVSTMSEAAHLACRKRLTLTVVLFFMAVGNTIVPARTQDKRITHFACRKTWKGTDEIQLKSIQ
jgi:hypothetical protein